MEGNLRPSSYLATHSKSITIFPTLAEGRTPSEFATLGHKPGDSIPCWTQPGGYIFTDAYLNRCLAPAEGLRL